jgi:NifB/MoaA-like Fe-S oxidoreductase
MRQCAKECVKVNKPCEQKDCRLWIDYKKELNCCLISIEESRTGRLTLHEVGERLGFSFVRIRQIEQKAIQKMSKIFLTF